MANLKEQHRRKIYQGLEKELGRPVIAGRENRVVSASAEVLSGSPIKETERMYGLAYGEIQAFLKKTFATDEERYQFLEEAMIGNSALAMKRFGEVYGEMTAMDAARAATMFAGKAAELRKARLEGFREPAINIITLQRLEKNLKVISEKSV